MVKEDIKQDKYQCATHKTKDRGTFAKSASKKRIGNNSHLLGKIEYNLSTLFSSVSWLQNVSDDPGMVAMAKIRT